MKLLHLWFKSHYELASITYTLLFYLKIQYFYCIFVPDLWSIYILELIWFFHRKIKVWDLQAALDPRAPAGTLCLRTLVVSITLFFLPRGMLHVTNRSTIWKLDSQDNLDFFFKHLILFLLVLIHPDFFASSVCTSKLNKIIKHAKIKGRMLLDFSL